MNLNPHKMYSPTITYHIKGIGQWFEYSYNILTGKLNNFGYLDYLFFYNGFLKLAIESIQNTFWKNSLRYIDDIISIPKIITAVILTAIFSPFIYIYSKYVNYSVKRLTKEMLNIDEVLVLNNDIAVDLEFALNKGQYEANDNLRRSPRPINPVMSENKFLKIFSDNKKNDKLIELRKHPIINLDGSIYRHVLYPIKLTDNNETRAEEIIGIFPCHISCYGWEGLDNGMFYFEVPDGAVPVALIIPNKKNKAAYKAMEKHGAFFANEIYRDTVISDICNKQPGRNFISEVVILKAFSAALKPGPDEIDCLMEELTYSMIEPLQEIMQMNSLDGSKPTREDLVKFAKHRYTGILFSPLDHNPICDLNSATGITDLHESKGPPASESVNLAASAN